MCFCVIKIANNNVIPLKFCGIQNSGFKVESNRLTYDLYVNQQILEKHSNKYTNHNSDQKQS